MMRQSNLIGIITLIVVISGGWITAMTEKGCAGDLHEVRKAGKLRYLGIVYANFVTKEKTGLDVELMQLFSKHIGVTYEFVESDWKNILSDLIGKSVIPRGQSEVEITGEAPIRGDVIATGFTILPWRGKAVDFSEMTFPTGVWLIARSDSPILPIIPTEDIYKDIKAVKKKLSGRSVLTLENSCLAPDLYGLGNISATVKMFPADQNLDGMIPVVLAKMADTTLMDVPVALIALGNWPGEIKVIGPISLPQKMACAFAKTSPDLRRAFDQFLRKCKADGRYKELIKKYYPSVFLYYPEFLKH